MSILSFSLPRRFAFALFLCLLSPAQADLMITRGAGPGGSYYNSIQRYQPSTGAFVNDFGAMNEGWTGLCLGPDGNLYAVTNILGYGTVYAFGPDGALVKTLLDAGLMFPGDITFGPDGHLYAQGNTSGDWTSPAFGILKFNGSTGEAMGTFATPSGGASWIGNPLFGPDGHLYLTSDVGIVRHDGATGAFMDVRVPLGAGGLADPRSIAFSAAGNLHAGDAALDAVLRYDGDTGGFIDAFVPAASGGLADPLDLTFGPDGHLYVASEGSGKVLRYDGGTGAFIDAFVSSAMLQSPRQIVFNAPSGESETVWIDDALPPGAVPGAFGGDAWTWFDAPTGTNPLSGPLSGGVAHRSALASGLHEHYFNFAEPLMVNAGDKLFTYVQIDAGNPPREIMLNWNDGSSWEHRAYWGANLITAGTPGTGSRRYVGPIPSSYEGRWMRLEVSAAMVGLEGKAVQGMSFTLFDGRVSWDRTGKVASVTDHSPPGVIFLTPAAGTSVSNDPILLSAEVGDDVGIASVQFTIGSVPVGPQLTSPPWEVMWNPSGTANGTHLLGAIATDTAGNQGSAAVAITVNNPSQPPPGPNGTLWFQDELPDGAWTGASGGDRWSWLSTPKPPFAHAGHESALASGLHEHYFTGATELMNVFVGDTLRTDVYLDPAHPPREIMLSWYDGTWEHRAYWGENLITYGQEGTAGRRYMGPLPPAGVWRSLSIAAHLIGLEGRAVSGMSFTLFDGRAIWSGVARSSTFSSDDVTPPTVAILTPTDQAEVSGSHVSLSAEAEDDVRVASVQFHLDGSPTGDPITTAPHTLLWDSHDVSDGAHLLTAVAMDPSGNQTTSTAVRIVVDNATPPPSSSTIIWFDDALPAGAAGGFRGSAEWNWVASAPAPRSGSLALQSTADAGLHESFFNFAYEPLVLGPDDRFFIHVFIDPAHPPRQIVLSWCADNWEHRAYWGENLLNYATNGTAAQYPMGPMPSPGQWIRLEVPASVVGLQGAAVQGLSLTLFDGRVTWDAAGKTNP